VTIFAPIRRSDDHTIVVERRRNRKVLSQQIHFVRSSHSSRRRPPRHRPHQMDGLTCLTQATTNSTCSTINPALSCNLVAVELKCSCAVVMHSCCSSSVQLSVATHSSSAFDFAAHLIVTVN
jgi:hypothetical protein